MKNRLLTESEHDIQTSIMQYLQYKGFFVWRNNSGMIRATNAYGQKHMVRMGQAGLPDLFAVKMDYPLIGIEVKREKGKVTDIQARMHQELKEHGVAVLVAHSITEVENRLKLL